MFDNHDGSIAAHLEVSTSRRPARSRSRRYDEATLATQVVEFLEHPRAAKKLAKK